MPAPKGNKYWQFGNPGRPKIFKTPEALWDKAIEYFDWANANPWRKFEAVKAGEHFGENVSVPIERPLSYEGFCLFANISRETFDNYCKEKSYKEYFDVAAKIKEVIDNQQFEGAMVGAFNPQVSMRKLGMKERIDHTTDDDKIVLPAITVKLKNDNT
jgi:hypothetical protein